MTDAPFDDGLQSERTLLAWRRTCLAVAVGGVLVVRFGFPALGAPAVAVGTAIVLLAVLAYVIAAARYRRVHSELTRGRGLPPAGLTVTIVAVAVALFGLAGFAWLIAEAA